MGKIAATTGGVGDAVYSIPILRKLNVDTLYIKKNFYHPPYGCMFCALYPLLETQGITCKPCTGGTPFSVYDDYVNFDYDIDRFREQGNRDTMHIIRNMMLKFRCYDRDWNKPFLRNIPISNDGYNLFFLSQRWRENSKVDWKKIYAAQTKPSLFIGFPEDHKIFCERYGKIEYQFTSDLLQMAIMIAHCDALYTNQSVALTLAQGLGKEYYLELKPLKTNTRFFTKNEHIL